ncbi:hypothetical protein LCGC14_3073230, partial [marine sediment metagenome]
SEGLNIHGLICDELHVWKGRAFWDALKYGFLARSQPVHFVITTAGIFDKTTIGWEQHQRAVRVRDGEDVDQELLVFIRNAEVTDDWESPEVHKKANPSYGTILDPAELAKDAAEVKSMPTALNSFLRYRLNIWTEQLEHVIDMRAWDKCDGEVDEASLQGRRCFGGLDLASKRDVAAFVLLFPPTDDDPLWRVLPRFWIPRENASNREKVDNVPYITWAREGHIRLTGGTSIDYEGIRLQILADVNTFDLVEVAIDQWNAEYLRQRVDPTGELCVEFAQTLRNMSAPMKELVDVLVPSGLLAHAGHPVLRWMAANLASYEDGNGNIRPDKDKSTEKIDGIVGAIMAVGLA